MNRVLQSFYKSSSPSPSPSVLDVLNANVGYDYIRNNIIDYAYLKVENDEGKIKHYLLTCEDKYYALEYPERNVIRYLLDKYNIEPDKIIVPTNIYLTKQRGGYKKTYLVKELKDIATKNNIKITKKSNGKNVGLNKQELTTKLEKLKLI